jgi:hypothetical protein
MNEPKEPDWHGTCQEDREREYEPEFEHDLGDDERLRDISAAMDVMFKGTP